MTVDLDRRRSELLALRASVLGAAHDVLTDGIEQGELSSAAGDQHLADHAGELVEREMDASLEENAEHIVVEIDAALAALDAGRYGICQRCGATIPEERLTAVPYATLCVDCKARDERP